MNPIEETSTGGWLAVGEIIRAKQQQLTEMRLASEAASAPNGVSDLAKGYEAAPQQVVTETKNTTETQIEPAGKQATSGLSESEELLVQDLKSRDREVRAHEQAHASVGGQYAGAPSYTYQAAPNGQNYAIGGEVAIDASPVKGDPEATIAKMHVVIAAALAPAEPSDQDRKVASMAQAQQAQAIAELARQRADEQNGQTLDIRF